MSNIDVYIHVYTYDTYIYIYVCIQKTGCETVTLASSCIGTVDNGETEVATSI